MFLLQFLLHWGLFAHIWFVHFSYEQVEKQLHPPKPGFCESWRNALATTQNYSKWTQKLFYTAIHVSSQSFLMWTVESENTIWIIVFFLPDQRSSLPATRKLKKERTKRTSKIWMPVWRTDFVHWMCYRKRDFQTWAMKWKPAKTLQL